MHDTATLFDLTGKVVIVTGSTKGIGRAMVEGLAAAGASVVVSSRKQELCDAGRGGGRGARPGAEVLGSRATSASGTPSPGSSTAVLERFGRIDGLVNNAGINPARIGPADMTLDYWRKVFSVNLEGPLRHEPVRVPDHARPGRRQHRATSAPWPRTPAAPTSARTASSKAALLNLTKSMAMDWAQWNVRVNMLSPGPFMSEMMEGGGEDAARLPRAGRRRHVHEAHRRPAARSSGRSATWSATRRRSSPATISRCPAG